MLTKMENPIDTRYILIAFPGVQRVSITEFCAYYADAATHYAKESELELQPDPDDDDTYYPEIEYMTPNTGIINNLKRTYGKQSGEPVRVHVRDDRRRPLGGYAASQETGSWNSSCVPLQVHC